MDTLWLLLIVNTVASLFVSSFFNDRRIGMSGVFWISVFFSPLIGILIGLSSERVKRKPSNPYDKVKADKKELLDRIETLMKEKDLGLWSDEKESQLTKLKENYLSDSDEREAKRRRQEQLEKIQRSKDKRLVYVLVLLISTALVVFLKINYG